MNQRPNCKVHGVIEKNREFQKNIYFSVIDYAKRLVLDLDLVLDCVDHSKLENS